AGVAVLRRRRLGVRRADPHRPGKATGTPPPGPGRPCRPEQGGRPTLPGPVGPVVRPGESGKGGVRGGVRDLRVRPASRQEGAGPALSVLRGVEGSLSRNTLWLRFPLPGNGKRVYTRSPGDAPPCLLLERPLLASSGRPFFRPGPGAEKSC